MKKKMIILFILVIFGFSIYFFAFYPSLMINWKIYVPFFDSNHYVKVTEPSFKIGGHSYYVLKYNSGIKKTLIKTNKWEKLDFEKYENYSEKMMSILDLLDVPVDKRPDYIDDFKYIYLKSGEYDSIYILYSDKNGLLYILENF